MKILVTGCNGQLGRAINKEYENNRQVEIVNTDVQELDITSIDDVMAMMKEVQPDAIINCAAHTGVDACETDLDNAYRINAIGPRNLAIAARAVGAKLVQVSTDYVFAGNASKPYTEFDTPDPQGAYGATKYAGEKFVEQFGQDYFIIRTAWLYGEGKNFVKTMLRLAKTNDTVRVVKDQFGTPTTASELAKMIVHILPTQNYGIYHGTCEGMCNWAEFAEEIFRLAGLKTKVEAITTKEYPTPAVRPAYSVLDNYMLTLTSDFKFKDWKDACKEYMETIL